MVNINDDSGFVELSSAVSADSTESNSHSWHYSKKNAGPDKAIIFEAAEDQPFDGDSGESHTGEIKSKHVVWWRKMLGNGNTATHKTLQPRHISFLALGGAIGTGVFFSIGASVAQGGPGGALVIYGITSVFVLSVVWCLAEMVAYIPHSGAFQHYGSRFLDESFGFALGINYYLQWAFSIPSEVSSGTFIIGYWSPSTPTWVWCFVIIFPIALLQFANVKWYGEAEFWTTLVKVVLLGFFIIIGLLWDWGGIPTESEPSPGLEHFREGLNFKGGFPGLFAGGYAFYSFGGTELVALTSGETKKPWKSIPAAAKMTFWRIVILMMMTVLVIGLCISANDPRLVQADDDSDVTVSPITLVFQFAGFKEAKHLINAVLLVAILSALNSCFYASSRMLMALAHDGQFFKVFAWTNSWGVPVPAQLVTLAIGCLVFLTTLWGNEVVFTWFMNVTGASAIITWTSIGAISFRFHMALRAQKIPLDDLPFRQRLFPLLPVLTVGLGLFLFAAQIYGSCPTGHCNWKDPFGTLLGVIVFVVCYFGWKFTHWRTDTLFRPHSQLDVTTGAAWAAGAGPQIMADDRSATYNKRRLGRQTAYGRIRWFVYRLGSPLEHWRQAKLHRTDASSEEGKTYTEQTTPSTIHP